MSSSRVQAPPVNLKERIAALQQRNAAQRSVSPTPPSSIAPAPTGSALRERIARFEKKGGVPVPRGSFGLGAPPPTDSNTRKRGELYGNRIPQPVRIVSAGNPQTGAGNSRPTSPLDYSSPTSIQDKRRSFSLSTYPEYVVCNVDGTPLSSPQDNIPPSPPRPDSSIPSNSYNPPSFSMALESTETAVVDVVDESNSHITQLNDHDETLQDGIVSDVSSVTSEAVLPETVPEPVEETVLNQVPTTIPVITVEEDDAHGVQANMDSKSTVVDATPDIADSPHPTSLTVDDPSVPVPHEDKPVTIESPPQESESSNVPISHTLILKAAGLGSPTSDGIQSPAISATLSSDGEGDMYSPVVPLPSPSAPQSNFSLEPIHEEAVFKPSVPVLSIDGVIAPPSPPMPGSALASSDIEGHSSPSNKEATVNAREESVEKTITMPNVEVVLTRPASPKTPRAQAFNQPRQSEDNTVPSLQVPQLNINSLPIRPVSMIELGPGGEGTLPSLGSDVTGGKTEDEEEQERGSVTILHGRSHSVGQTNKINNSRQSFSAVVHGKVKEVPAVVNHAPLIPQTPQFQKMKGTNAIMVPPSPGYNELAMLLQNAVMLEESLGQEKPSAGIPVIVSTEPESDEGEMVRQEDGVEIRRLSREEAEESRRTLVKLQAKREEQAKSKIRSTFRRTKTAASSTTSLYVDPSASTSTLISSSPPLPQQYATKRLKSPSVPHLLGSVEEDASKPRAQPRSQTPEMNMNGQGRPPSVTSKSPRSKFPTFRRLGGSKSSKDSLSLGGSTRYSVSTSSEISSEDSVPTAVTPPDNALDFGDIHDRGHKGSGGGGMTWPSLSPNSKKSGGSMARAATFAGKIWQRARTKSGASTVSSHDRFSSEPAPSLPPLPTIIQGSSDLDSMVYPTHRHQSMKTPSENPPPLPPKGESYDRSRSVTPQPHPTRLEGLSPVTPSKFRRPGAITNDLRPSSWMSVSSTGSTIPSSIWDSELFDAFPSVPQSHPSSASMAMSPVSPSLSMLPSPKRGTDVGMMNGGGGRGRPSFDAQLLSSAAHLTSEGPSPPVTAASLGTGLGLGYDLFPPTPLVSPYSPPDTATATYESRSRYGPYGGSSS